MNNTLGILTICFALAASMGSAMADPWKDESGKGRERGDYSRPLNRDDDNLGRGGSRQQGRYEGRERKEEYDDGRCKIERKWSKDGEYKEERKCRGNSGAYRRDGNRDNPGYGSSNPRNGDRWVNPESRR